jgi:hypothetical protein
MSDALELIAYDLHGTRSMPLEPASSAREWMSANGGYAKRCLPLLIANQAGWLIRNPFAFRANWDGGDGDQNVKVEYLEPTRGAEPVGGHFGLGTLTWTVPYLFRTPPGWNLHARGPANLPKDGIAPLEGVVETDWSFATFTMNWKFTRPDHEITFEKGEPFCMVVPQRRGELEAFVPSVRDIADEPEVQAGFEAFRDSRNEQLARQFAARFVQGGEAIYGEWQKHYIKGTNPGGQSSTEHQTKLRLARFADAGDR